MTAFYPAMIGRITPLTTTGAQPARMPAGSPGGVGGQFTSFQKVMAQQNSEAAVNLQNLVVELMDARWMRPRVLSGRLLQNTKSPRNRSSSQFGFEVGVWKWMDQGTSRYWRTIEYGSVLSTGGVGFRGTPLYGWFSGTGANRVSAGGPYSPPRKALRSPKGQGVFVPYSTERGRSLRGQGGRRNAPGPGVITVEVRAQLAYTDAWRIYRARQAGGGDFGLAALRLALIAARQGANLSRPGRVDKLLPPGFTLPSSGGPSLSDY